ncbi:MAG TPA: type II secretion system F family protein [Vicinamibacterales bacterium]|nr:type II secretion system F family protein [Vicinamibacterales bacterium]
MEFRCRLVSAAGEVVEGTYAAESEARLRHDFENQGLHVLSLRKRTALTGGGLLPKRHKIAHHEFLVFNQEFATLLKAGMPLVQSIDLLRHQVTNTVFRSVLDDVHEKVRGGIALSDAFGDHGNLFPRVYTASLLAGERSGNLDAILRRYVAYEKVIDTVRRKTISALIYPAILIALAIGLVGIIVLRVVPAFSEFYDSFGRQLPLSTRIILGISNVARAQFTLMVAALAIAGAVFTSWIRRPGQRARFDHAVLTIPFIGETIRKFTTAQMARTLATLLGGGIPLVNSLEVTARSVGNRHIADELDFVTQRVREGQGLAASLKARAVVPEVALKMIEVGESTGSLQDMLGSLADFYEEEVETSVGRFVTIIEPALLVIMGVVIAALVLALYMPLFELSSVVN